MSVGIKRRLQGLLPMVPADTLTACAQLGERYKSP